MLEQINQYRAKLAEDLKNEFGSIENKFIQNNTHFEEYKQSIETIHNEMQDRISSNTGKCIALKEQNENLKGFQELLNSRFEKLSARMTNFNTTISTRITELNEGFDLKIRKIKDSMDKESENVINQFDITRMHCKDLVETSKDKTAMQVEALNESFRANMSALKTTLENSLHEVAAKNKSNIVKIKEVCTKYFEKNDEIMKTMQGKANNVNQAYDEFFANVIKPQQIGEARIYAIETRLKEEEDYRILEATHIKDVVKKLIFAIEQANLCNQIN